MDLSVLRIGALSLKKQRVADPGQPQAGQGGGSNASTRESDENPATLLSAPPAEMPRSMKYTVMDGQVLDKDKELVGKISEWLQAFTLQTDTRDGPHGTSAKILKDTRGDDHALFCVAQYETAEGSEVVGICIVLKPRRPTSRSRNEVKLMVVKDEYRRRKIAQALWTTLTTLNVFSKSDRFVVDAPACLSNCTAMSFWKTQGFKAEEKRKKGEINPVWNWDPPEEDANILNGPVMTNDPPANDPPSGNTAPATAQKPGVEEVQVQEVQEVQEGTTVEWTEVSDPEKDDEEVFGVEEEEQEVGSTEVSDSEEEDVEVYDVVEEQQYDIMPKQGPWLGVPELRIMQTTLKEGKGDLLEEHGLFCAKVIKRGQFIVAYTGTFMGHNEFERRVERLEPESRFEMRRHSMQVPIEGQGQDYQEEPQVLFVTPSSGNESDSRASNPAASINEPPKQMAANCQFFVHSCLGIPRPGTYAQQPNYAAILFYASEDIEAYQEIFVHYGLEYQKVREHYEYQVGSEVARPLDKRDFLPDADEVIHKAVEWSKDGQTPEDQVLREKMFGRMVYTEIDPDDDDDSEDSSWEAGKKKRKKPRNPRK